MKTNFHATFISQLPNKNMILISKMASQRIYKTNGILLSLYPMSKLQKLQQ
jgi:hypothetical protein